MTFDNCLVFSSLLEVIDNEKDKYEIFIIGGAEIYRQSLPLATKLYLTKIHAEFDDADTFFPDINYSEWEEVSREKHRADEKNPYDFSIVIYKKTALTIKAVSSEKMLIYDTFIEYNHLLGLA